MRESDLYHCVVSIAGVADLRALSRDATMFFGGRQSVEYTLGDDSAEECVGMDVVDGDRNDLPG